MPKAITLKEFKEGLELAQPIKNKFGQVLIPEDVKLEDRHKKILLTWGINEIIIKDEVETILQVNEAILSEAKNKLKARMKWNARNQNEEELYNLALDELVKKMIGN